MPHDIVPNTAIHFHAHWVPGTAGTGQRDTWEFEYMYARGFNQESYDPEHATSPETRAGVVTASEAVGAQYPHHVTESAAVTLANLDEPDGIIYIRLGRVTNGTSPLLEYSGDVFHANRRHSLPQPRHRHARQKSNRGLLLMAKQFSQLLIGNVYSSTYLASENDANAADDVEVVGFLLSGTWAGATATLQVCMDSSASPRVFANVPAASFTQNVADSWHIPSDAYFRLNVTGAGSPQQISPTERQQVAELSKGHREMFGYV